jgi:putative FmdB family regulatory protein
MPIYEFACPKCRVIFNFFSKRINPEHPPKCPKCGRKNLTKQMSRFAMTKGIKETDPSDSPAGDDQGGPNMDDPRVIQAMSELEKDMDNLDENNPKHMAHMMRKMKDMMPAGSIPKEFDTAIKRLEAGEDPEKIEADMGDLFGELMGGEGSSAGGGYSHDSNLYDY